MLTYFDYTVIWPCDIQGQPDETDDDDNPTVQNYIVDDVRICYCPHDPNLPPFKDVHKILIQDLPAGVHLVVRHFSYASNGHFLTKTAGYRSSWTLATRAQELVSTSHVLLYYVKC